MCKHYYLQTRQRLWCCRDGQRPVSSSTKWGLDQRLYEVCAYIYKHRPKTRWRPLKHFHPLLEREKQLDEKVHKILPKAMAEQLCPKGSRLAHLYGLPKTHKERPCMRLIVSATGACNYPLGKWLDEKLKRYQQVNTVLTIFLVLLTRLKTLVSNLTKFLFPMMCQHYLPIFL